MTTFLLAIVFAFAIIVAAITVTVTIAVTIAIAVTILLTAITITVTLLGFESVDDDRELHVATLQVLDDAGESILVRHALTDDEEIGVGVAHQKQSIGDQTDRRRVDDNVIVAFLQFLKQLIAFCRSNQLSRIRRNRAAGDDVECRYLSRRLDDSIKIFLVAQITAQSYVVGKVKLLEQPWFAQIESKQQSLLAIQRIDRCNINADKRLLFG